MDHSRKRCPTVRSALLQHLSLSSHTNQEEERALDQYNRWAGFPALTCRGGHSMYPGASAGVPKGSTGVKVVIKCSRDLVDFYVGAGLPWRSLRQC